MERIAFASIPPHDLPWAYNLCMRVVVAIMLGVMAFPFVGVFAAAGDDPPFTYLALDQRLRYSELVCSATILDTQLTGRTLNLSSATTAENLARADVDTVLKGKLTGSTIMFHWYSWPAPEDPNNYAYSGPPLADLRPGMRYLLFLRSDGAEGWRVTIPMYQLEILLAPWLDASLRQRLDSSGLTDAGRNHELAQEFAAAAHFVEPLGDAADVYDYFSWMAELLGKEAVPFIRPFLKSATLRLRYFAADRLAEMKSDAGRDVLLATLKSRDLDALNRGHAALDLGRLQTRDALPDLEKFATDDPEPAVRYGAIRGLGEVADTSSAKALVGALDDPVDDNRIYAAFLLEKIIYGQIYAPDLVKDHEAEIIASWRIWLAGNGPPPDYSHYLR